MSDLRKAAQQALWALQYHVEMTWPIDRTSEAIFNLRAALAQQAEPKGGGNLPPPLQAEPVTEDMKSAVRWAPSSAYWSERLREFFGPDAREGIDALERRITEAQERAEPDLSRCPQCNGPADNGHDRSIPPSPYLCTKCMAEPPQRKPLTEEEIDVATAQERDALLDHIYEYGTAAEGVLERIRKLCRAIERAHGIKE